MSKDLNVSESCTEDAVDLQTSVELRSQEIMSDELFLKDNLNEDDPLKQLDRAASPGLKEQLQFCMKPPKQVLPEVPPTPPDQVEERRVVLGEGENLSHLPAPPSMPMSKKPPSTIIPRVDSSTSSK
mmetsp:Transcript_51652/g.82055  ORF Transcript_51652/g.82055 Transcript_51652/m.82055 type:complete len:127 (-) Transcript_51652:56-436(-)